MYLCFTHLLSTLAICVVMSRKKLQNIYIYKVAVYESDSIEFGVILDAEQVELPGGLVFSLSS